MPKKFEDLTFKFSNRYYVSGTATIVPWGGGIGKIQMCPFYIDDLKKIKEKINDGGFGCEKIEKAVCDIFSVYKCTNDNCDEVLKYFKTQTIKMGDDFGRTSD